MRNAVWYDAVIWLIFTALGFLTPVLVTAMFSFALGNSPNLEALAGSGQFAVFGTGLLMTTCYFVVRPGSLARLPLTEWFMIASIVGLVIGLFLFMLLTLTDSTMQANPALFHSLTIVLFFVALLVAFIAVALDKTREIQKPRFLERNIQAERENLDKAFEDTL